jgi:Thrombospondin C-terminal region/PEP-CTERM motif
MKVSLTKCGAIAFALVAAVSIADTTHAAAVDLRTWKAESYPAVAGFGAGVWTPTASGSSVTQSVNGQPTVYYSDFMAYSTKVTGTIRSSGGDDDFIGFVIGYNPNDSTNASANYLLIDWKAATQFFDFGNPSTTPGGTALRGLAVSRVTGTPTADEFWQHADYSSHPGGGVQELQRAATLGSTGWTRNVDYQFSFDFGPNNLIVAVNGVEQLNIAGAFNNGRLGFYNFSQAGVTYSAFDNVPGGFGAVPEPATWAMMLTGLGLVGIGLRRRSNGTHALG